MVQGQAASAMLISEFARAAGLPQDTVRFYVKKGLITPRRGQLGGSSAYQTFTEDDLVAVRMVRLQQSLGYSLGEIAGLNEEYRRGARSRARTVEVLRTQIERLEDKKGQLEGALAFLRDKLEWIEAGKPAGAPRIGDYRC